MYIGEVHRATVEEEHLVARGCRRCGEKLRARVHSSGGGAAHAPFFVGRAAAAEAARMDASADARAHATGLTHIAACPACGHRERAVLVGAAVWDGVLLFLVVGVFGSIAAMLAVFLVLAADTAAGASAVAMVGLGLFFGIRKARRTLVTEQRTADDAVLWLFCDGCRKAVAPDDADASWSPCAHCGRAVHEACAREHELTHVTTSAYR